MTLQFFDMVSLSNFADVVIFLLSSLVTGPSFMSISSLVLELWQFPFVRYWPEIRKSEILPSEFCPISEDLGELGIPNLVRTPPIKWYRFYCFWVINGKSTRGVGGGWVGGERVGAGGLKLPPPLSTQIRVKNFFSKCDQILNGKFNQFGQMVECSFKN